MLASILVLVAPVARYFKQAVFDAIDVFKAACDDAGIPMADAAMRWPPPSPHPQIALAALVAPTAICRPAAPGQLPAVLAAPA